MKQLFLYLLPLTFVVLACESDTPGPTNEPMVDFDRQAMLTDWVDNVITPAYADFNLELGALVSANEAFVLDPTPVTFEDLQSSFVAAYRQFQRVDPFLIGLAEQMRLRDQLNTYPADTELILANVSSGDANLALPSNVPAQGFPALDYLLYGLDLSTYTTGPEAAAYRNYLTVLVDRMAALSGEAADYWTAGVRQAFIENDGNSATASIDRTVNDYVFYYEKFLRAGKVGIPAGIFSDDPLADRAEALYSGISPELFGIALDATQDFFEHHGLADYLDAFMVERDGEMLSTQIISQFNAARTQAARINLNFSEQVLQDNVQMLELYNALQRNTVRLKVDMMQALSISVDYVDADGD